MTPEQQCRAAWAAQPDAKWAWCCHHGARLEPLTEPARRRIDYIRDYKPEHEQERRFNNFRPVLSPLPEELTQAWAAYDQAWTAYDQAWTAYDQARTAYDQARKALYQAWTAYECAEAHLRDVPNHTWNGKDIF